MRLLRCDGSGQYKFESFTEQSKTPEYAILSHTWASEEVTYADMMDGSAKNKGGYEKIDFCGKRATADDIHYIWIDTCCIDKMNGPEIQEAVISMFRWYHKATKCYVYLTDVSATASDVDDASKFRLWNDQFRKSRWFTRGWTLQELLAPPCVEFYSLEGTRLGDKQSSKQCLMQITGIPLGAFEEESLSSFTIDQRFSWAEHRQTTRIEDRAYSLMGLFEVQIPVLYGEGEIIAFKRLRNEIENDLEERIRLDNLANDLPTSSTAAFNSANNQHKQLCLPNTRVEVLQDIEKWAYGSDDRYIYWLNGLAGMGKSTIARTAARTFDKKGTLGGTFFYSKGGGDASKAGKLMTTLASQMASRIPSVKPHICRAILEHKDIATQSLPDQWEKLIIEPLSKMRPAEHRPDVIILVIDALDECDSARDIRMVLNTLATTEKLRKLSLRVFITSRPEIPIRAEFEKIPRTRRQGYVLHHISPETVDRDLTIFFEHKFKGLREERGLSSTWPESNVISRLVATSRGLFIWASTAWLWIQTNGRLVKQRVKKLINAHRSEAGAMSPLDKMYITVLEDSIRPRRTDEEGLDECDDLAYDDDEKAELLGKLREILGTIVILTSPLSLPSLAVLLDIDAELITDTLADLHAILHIPTDINQPILLHHPTFHDFILDSSRCTNADFCVQEKVAQNALATNCVRLMSESLHSNICRLPSPGSLVKHIEHSRSESEHFIKSELQYACLYWAEHYRRGGVRLRDEDDAHEFFKKHFLNWLEIISLMGKSSDMAAIIRMYQSLLKPVDNSKQIDFVKDARRFMFASHSTIEQAPLQVYCAALLYIRPSNRLRHQFWDERHPMLKAGRIVGAIAPEAKDEYNYVNDLAFSPNGKQLVSGSLEPSVRVWDVSTGSPFTRYEGQIDKISSVAISPNGKLLASGSDDTTVMVWNMPEKTVRWMLVNHTRWVNTVTFSPDGRLLASGSMDETIRLWSIETGEELEVLNPDRSCINSLAFSPSGDLLASGTVDQSIILYDVKSKGIRTILDGHTGPVNSVQFSPNGKQLVSGSDDLTIRIWDVRNGVELKRMKGHHKKIWAVAFSHDARTIASGSEDKTIRLWDAATGKENRKIVGHTSGVNAVVFSPDKKLLASGSFNDEVKLWDAKSGDRRGELADFDFERDAEAGASPEETSVAELANSDVTTSSAVVLQSKAHAGVVSQLVFSKNGIAVASGSDDGVIKLWTQEGVEQLVLQGHLGSINHMVLSSGGTLLASASADKTAKLWDLGSGNPRFTLQGHSGDVLRVRFSPDERSLATCSLDGHVRLWDVSRGGLLHKLERHSNTVNDIAFSPDGRTIASCSDDSTICIWDFRSPARYCRQINAHELSVNSIAFSSDGAMLLSTSSDTMVKTWTATGEVVNTFSGHTLPVRCGAFSEDMTKVVSCSDDGTVRTWNIKAGSIQDLHDVGTPLKHVSFTVCGRYLETDRGSLPANKHSENTTQPSEERGALFVSRDWVTCNAHNIICLPMEYHATSVATRDDTVVIGHESGALSFIRLNSISE